MSLKSKITSLFQMHGLVLKGEGSQYLSSLLEPIDVSEHEGHLDKVLTALQKLPLASAVISKADVVAAVKEISASARPTATKLLQVISPSDTPRLEYSTERGKFLVVPPSKALHGTARDKANVSRNRYIIVYQRLKQHELFKAPAVGTPAHRTKVIQLTKIDFLAAGGGYNDNVVVLGMLTQIMEDKMHLEDDTGAVCVDLSNTSFQMGLYPLNCLVLVEGQYEDGVLQCTAAGLPPCEDATVTRGMLGNVNYFGGPEPTCAKLCPKMQGALQSRESMFVILSDVWLDRLQVMNKLEQLLQGYSNYPPAAFILCGDFLSNCHTHQQVLSLRHALGRLGHLIAQHPKLLTSSRFIFVPGPSDPGPNGVYPRPPLPPSLVSELVSKIPNAEFPSNPCRIQYCTREIVVFREDLLTKMCRNSVYFPATADDVPAHFAKTLVCNAHLGVLPPQALPTYWAQDHCLSLHPTPDVIVTADRYDSFTTSYENCIVTNPGSFMKTDFSFKVYYPKRNEVEDSQINMPDPGMD